MNTTRQWTNPLFGGMRLFCLLLSLGLLYGCGGGGGGKDETPASGPITPVVDCAGAAPVGTLTVTVLAPNTSTNIPIAAATVTISGLGCTGETGTLGTLEFQNVPVDTAVFLLARMAGLTFTLTEVPVNPQRNAD